MQEKEKQTTPRIRLLRLLEMSQTKLCSSKTMEHLADRYLDPTYRVMGPQ